MGAKEEAKEEEEVTHLPIGDGVSEEAQTEAAVDGEEMMQAA
jgi:hypothetical protein